MMQDLPTRTAFLFVVSVLAANLAGADDRSSVVVQPVTVEPAKDEVDAVVPFDAHKPATAGTASEVGFVSPTDLSLTTYGPPSPFAVGVERSSRSTAVALNYCRASLHRIRTQPGADVLAEERRRILDNLSLAGIADPEVIQLYSALLDEIGSIPLRDSEKQLTRSNHNRSIRRQVTWDVIAFSTELATAQFGSAIKTGADSWWDVRDRTYRREMEQLKLDRGEMRDVVSKSTLFLDTFWKLARKRSIPDAWLVRGADLDRLAQANQEESAEVRLRRLVRLEAFLVAYPPYWYHVARTQQEIGLFGEAIETYSRLELLETGHFRVDEMLAASLANMALLQDAAGDRIAAHTAARALAAAPDVPEANLAAARVLQRQGQLAMAEEAILRNVDSGLQLATSQTFRLGLYYHSGDNDKLIAALSDPAVVQTASAGAVLKCLARLEPSEYPQTVIAELSRSLAAYPQINFGADELIIAADYRWRLPQLGFQFPVHASDRTMPQIARIRGGYSARFAQSFEWGHPFSPPETMEVELVLTYPDKTKVALTLSTPPNRQVADQSGRSSRNAGPLMITRARIEGVQVSFDNTPLRSAALIGDDIAIE